MLTEYNSYAIFFTSNKRDLYLKCYSKKEITPRRFYNLIDNIVSKCLNDDFVGAIHHATNHELILIDENEYCDLNCYKAEIDFDKRLVEIDYGFVCQINIKFEEFHESVNEMVKQYWGR